MKGSELIKQLQKIIDRHGDVEVIFESAGFNAEELFVITSAARTAYYLDEEFDIEGTDLKVDEDNTIIMLKGRSIGVSG